MINAADKSLVFTRATAVSFSINNRKGREDKSEMNNYTTEGGSWKGNLVFPVELMVTGGDWR